MAPPAAAGSGNAEADGAPRMAKFLCSFGGSILPRPLDGRLRYVGGDTRIVMLPRDIPYADLATRMRELYEEADIIKYQQPDEDLDALVSVVNDDDVVNMMEEYDKLIAAGEGFTRLRVFLFSQHLDDEAASVAVHYHGDERETERRYVDALNSLGDMRSPSSPVSVEQLFGIGGNDSGIPDSLRHLNVPRPSHSQRYGDMDSPWSPAYISPGQYGVHDPRDFPVSPSSARFQVGAEDFDERIPDDFVRHSPKYRHYEAQSPPHVDNLVWLPPGAVVQQNAGFPGNLGRSGSFLDGNSVYDISRSPFQKGQGSVSDPRYVDPRWRPVQQHFDQSGMTNEYSAAHPANNARPDFGRPGEQYVVPQDVRLENGVYVKEQTGGHPPVFYNESLSHDRAWHAHAHPNQSHQRYEDPRLNGRVMEPYIDSNSANSAFATGKVYEMHSASHSRSSHESPHYYHGSGEHINDAYHNQQVVSSGSYVQTSGFDESTGQHYSHSSTYGADSFYQMQQNLPPLQSLRRRANSPVHTGSPYESPHLPIPNGSINSNFVRNTGDVSPRVPGVPVYDRLPNAWPPNGNIPYRVIGHDSPAVVENPSALVPRPNPNTAQYVQPFFAPESVQQQPGVPLIEIYPERACAGPMLSSLDGRVAVPALPLTDRLSTLDINTTKKPEGPEDERHIQNVTGTKPSHAVSDPSTLVHHVGVAHEVDPKQGKPTEHEASTTKVHESGAIAMQECGDISEDRLNFIPELVASVKKAALEDAEKPAEAQPDARPAASPVCDDENDGKKFDEITDGDQDSDLHGSGDQHKSSGIEATTAEAEALSKGLQTIKNDDLEEIRELGSGTYGAVFHGKWRGCDVAIKRIKASCFAGRPSERERLIADFWKEAQILSSLHHPNVVSFYGVVRDGPDGSLATVTEFMINGSLKQFLRKKDRTIDRRKRVILAMDAAFGMEYLHGKNIVHFDLKCENLLVNMRDPQRPICKIGDLGLSKVKQHTLVSGGVRGTLPWMAPELLSGKSNMVSDKIDVYSFGIVMWELLTGDEPYSDMRAAEIIGGIVNNSLRPQIPSWCDPEWKSLMEGSWAGEPAERPSFTEISQRLRKMAAAMNVK